MKMLLGISTAVLLAIASSAHASCGANFCAVNLMRTTDSQTPRFDLRFEYIDQDQPRVGRDKVNVGAIPGHHDEVRTLNRNVVASFDLPVARDWALALQLPFVSRDHTHVHNHHGAQLTESWEVDGIGDVRALARYSINQQNGNGWTAIAGLKLPTGEYDRANADGQLAERTLQPGTGTTDAVVGLRYDTSATWGGTPLRRFAAIQIQTPFRAREDFRPGTQYNVDVGADAAITSKLNALLQVNGQIKSRDQGLEAEPEDSGGSFVWLSPGVSYTIGAAQQLYGFVQLPLYQRVNGIQLTADYALIIGFNTRF